MGASMRVDFCIFTAAADGEKVIVNPLLVRFFRSLDGGKTTTIYFANDHTLDVLGSPEEVQNRLTPEEEQSNRMD